MLYDLNKVYSLGKEEFFVITDQLNWEAGDFGDNDSQIFGKNRVGLMKDFGILAIQFYKFSKDWGKYIGYGRALLFPIGDNVVIFNGYGLSTIRIASTLAEFWGQSYKQVSIDINDVIWVNNGSGFLVGQQEKISDIQNVQLEIIAVAPQNK